VNPSNVAALSALPTPSVAPREDDVPSMTVTSAPSVLLTTMPRFASAMFANETALYTPGPTEITSPALNADVCCVTAYWICRYGFDCVPSPVESLPVVAST
jgi:hypothetical protein